ncbi:ComEC/Rec2 family competence protein [Occultella gossypii]|uniref:MBL fold metallo-hydrolase n=1 Tax=Occultella gossypii TaxID=2800820 RepID=A0ABS7S2W5_9MICO|nr:hypothetical protein [Occultella gossypii]MBZ2194684.1 hypothetical protein [Occultella gossypii]
MSRTFAVEMLPAREGDCLLVSWGDVDHPHRLLIDAGRAGTRRAIRDRFAAASPDERRLELLIVTHVDRDHIEGVLPLLSDPDPPITFRDVWFNGYHHLHDGRIETFGPVQGERLTRLLERPDTSWNGAFGGRSVEVTHAPEPVTLAGGLTLRVLAPDRDDLERLIPVWERECRRARLTPGGEESTAVDIEAPLGYESFGPIDVPGLAAVPYIPDPSEANGSSIVVLAEYEGRRVLLAADAHAETLVRALAPLAAESGSRRVMLDAVKVPHHGSRHNLSRELVALLESPRLLISTNGAHHQHPHDVALARILADGGQPHLVFNYRTAQTLVWDDDTLRAQWLYTTSYPPAGQDGTNAVDLCADPDDRRPDTTV